MNQKPEKTIGADGLCFIGAAEAMKYGSNKEGKGVRQKDLRAAEKARNLFDEFSDQEMAVALLIAMVDLGKRIHEKEAKALEPA